MGAEADLLCDEVLETCHALAADGLGGVIGGNVSARVPGSELLWTNILHLSFEELTRDDLALLDFNGRVLRGKSGVSGAISFHPGIYHRRPDVAAIVHTHSYWGTAQASFWRPPQMWNNVVTLFFDRVGMSKDGAFESVADALGPSDVAVIIPWHGAVTVGQNLGDAAALHSTFEYACKLDIMLAGTDARPLPARACRTMSETMRTSDYLLNRWSLMKRKAMLAH